MPALRSRPPGQSLLFDIDNRFYARRPASHVAGRRVHSFGGSVLVQQVRSTIGANRKSEMLELLQSVDLGTIDDACVVSEHDPIFGNIQTAQSFLSVEKLNTYVPPGDYQMWVLRDGVLMYKEVYGDAGGEIVVVGDGEYLQAESSDGQMAVMWSSQHALLDALESIGKLMGRPVGGDQEGFLQLTSEGEGASGYGSLADIAEYIRDAQPPVAFLRAKFERGELTWSVPFARITKHAPKFAEIGVRLHSTLDKELLEALVLATGSRELRRHLTDIESQIKQFAA